LWLCLWIGDAQTGRAWPSEFMVTGAGLQSLAIAPGSTGSDFELWQAAWSHWPFVGRKGAGIGC